MGNKPQTIQATSKRWKLMQLAAIALFASGIALVLNQKHAIGVLVFGASLLLIAIAAIGKWWTNR